MHDRSTFARSAVVTASALSVSVLLSCGAKNKPTGFFDEGKDATAAPDFQDGGLVDDADLSFGDAAPLCSPQCSADLHAVLDCQGNEKQKCTGGDSCDRQSVTCIDACSAARNNHQSVGCEYYATYMESFSGEANFCFAVFVANTWTTPAHITIERDGHALPVESFTRIPTGSGPALTYGAFSAANGIPPGEVAVAFLSGAQGDTPKCPVAGAVAGGAMTVSTGKNSSFRIASDVPVVAYEINPYGGGSSAVTGASLLLPTSAWDKNYVAVNAYSYDIMNPSMNIVAMEDNTKVTMVPVADVVGGGGIPGGAANTPMTFTLDKGQNAQFSQEAELTGSILQADKPIGLMGGHACLRIPKGVPYCDHAEQMIPPVQALGHEYVGVMYRPRMQEKAIWRVVGAVDGTTLTWSSSVGGPATLGRGQVAEFTTGDPFVVASQDKDHPFMLFSYMSGSQWVPGMDGYGDPDFVISVPPEQYMREYVFFADPTYPEGNLVVVRAKKDGKFEDVTLDCAGALTGWKPIGDYEWTRTDLITGDFRGIGSCSSGRHEMKSAAPFGLWVWGWGTPQTKLAFTANVSYGYPAGMNVTPINQVVIPPAPR